MILEFFYHFFQVDILLCFYQVRNDNYDLSFQSCAEILWESSDKSKFIIFGKFEFFIEFFSNLIQFIKEIFNAITFLRVLNLKMILIIDLYLEGLVLIEENSSTRRPFSV